MSKRTSLVVIAAGACLALSGFVALGQQSSDQQKCINKMNKDGAGVSKAQGKEHTSCLKKAGKGLLTGTAQACLTADEKMKVQGKKDKTIDDDTGSCGTVPSFGYTGAATVNTAAVQAQLDLTEDIFGSNLGSAVISCSADKDGCKCQQKILKDVEKLAATKLKEFLKCKKTTLKGPTVSASDLVACVNDGGTTGSIAADSKGKIQKGRDKLGSDVTGSCTGVSGAFPNSGIL